MPAATPESGSTALLPPAYGGPAPGAGSYQPAGSPMVAPAPTSYSPAAGPAPAPPVAGADGRGGSWSTGGVPAGSAGFGGAESLGVGIPRGAAGIIPAAELARGGAFGEWAPPTTRPAPGRPPPRGRRPAWLDYQHALLFH